MNVANDANDKLCDDNNAIESDQSPDRHGLYGTELRGKLEQKFQKTP